MRNFLAKVAMLCCLLSSAAYANEIENIRIWPAPDNTRVVFDMGAQPIIAISRYIKRRLTA